jgi:hypothetical protein
MTIPRIDSLLRRHQPIILAGDKEGADGRSHGSQQGHRVLILRQEPPSEDGKPERPAGIQQGAPWLLCSTDTPRKCAECRVAPQINPPVPSADLRP